MAAKKILIGGGTGFIGGRLGELMRNCGYGVTNISRMPGPNNISWIQLDLDGVPKGLKAVVNCAGQPFMDFTKSWSPGFKQNVYNSRVYTTKSLSAAINKSNNKPEVFVVVTGVGAYEPSETNKYDEKSPPTTATDFFSKLVVDMEAAAAVNPPVRLVIIRSGAVLGRWGGMIKNMFLPFYLGVGGPIGSGKQYLPWIHIDDLTRLIQFAIENDEVKGILNGVAPQVITNAQFTKSFAKALRRPAFIPVPEMMLNYFLNPERAMIMTKGQYVVPKKVLELGFQYLYPCIDDATKEFARLFPLKRPFISKGAFVKSQSFAKALHRPAFFTVPEQILNLGLNPERAMIMTKGQHVTPTRVLEYGFKYQYDNIDKACEEFAHLRPKV